MIDIKNYKTSDWSKSFCFVELNKFGISQEDAANRFFSDFMDMLGISVDEFLEAKNDLCILDRGLYDFTTWKGNNFLVGEDAIYTEKWVVRNGFGKMERKSYDVYVTKNSYSTLRLKEIAKYFISRRFPQLFSGNFVTSDYRFSEKTRAVKFEPNMKIGDLSMLVNLSDDITIGDLVMIMANKQYLTSKIEKPKLSIYVTDASKCDCYLTLSNHTLAFDLKDLMNKDWKAIEDKDVWVSSEYKGIPQKDRDYFNDPLVAEFKETFFK